MWRKFPFARWYIYNSHDARILVYRIVKYNLGWPRYSNTLSPCMHIASEKWKYSRFYILHDDFFVSIKLKTYISRGRFHQERRNTARQRSFTSTLQVIDSKRFTYVNWINRSVEICLFGIHRIRRTNCKNNYYLSWKIIKCVEICAKIIIILSCSVSLIFISNIDIIDELIDRRVIILTV